MNKRDEMDVGFSLIFTPDDDKKGVLGRIVCALLLFIGLGGCLWSALGLAGAGASPLLLLLTGCACCVLSCRLPGKWDFAYIGVVVILAVFVGVWSRFIIEGGGIVMNQLYAALEGYIGRAFPRFYVDEDANRALCATLFLIIPTGLLAILCGRVSGVAGGWRYVLLPIIIALWLVSLAFQAALSIICVLALIAAAIVLPSSRSISLRSAESNHGVTVWLLIMSALLTSLAAIPALFIINTDGSDSAAARLHAARKVHSMRYDGEYQTLPEGDFSRLPGFVLGEAPALTVTLDDIGKYYLRGFVGETYTGDGWTTLMPKRRAEYAELFVWLHERGFYAQNQYSLLKEALGEDSQTKELRITNDGVSTAYLYAPYELADNRADDKRIGDENLRASGLRGEGDYTILVSDGSVAGDERLYMSLVDAINRENTRAVEYLTSESAYREFVYDSYLEIPDNAHAAIERLLAEVEFPDGRVSFADAKMVVNAYMATFGYAETPEPSPARRDELTHFLEESRMGNSVHFATAATLMFRYMGVPARYVEGYLMTQGSETCEDGTVVLRSKDTYAWAEIYRDGVGFVPFEPEYPAIPPLAPIETIPPNDNIEEPPVIPPLLESRLWIAILLGVLGLLLLIFIILVIRRGMKRRRLSRLLSVDDNAVAVSRITTYSIQLLSHMGISRSNGSLLTLRTELESKFDMELSEKYSDMICVQQAALFSGQPVSDEDRACVGEFQSSVIERLRKQSNMFRRFRLRWIECIL